MGHQATNPPAHPHELDTLDSLRNELIQFAYETECRLEMLCEQMSHQARDLGNQVVEQTQPEDTSPAAVHCEGEFHSLQPFLSSPDASEPSEAKHSTVVPTSEVSASEASASEVSEKPTAPAEPSDPLERLAAIKRRIEKQLAKEAN